MNQGRLRVATYNVHSFVGADGKKDPTRVVRVIRELGAEVVALQEVATGGSPVREVRDLGDRLHAVAVPGPTLRRGLETYGNTVVSKCPILERRELDLSVAGFEARAALVLRLGWCGRSIRLVGTHFGLRSRERRRQAAALADHLIRSRASTDEFTLLLGDFNDWSRSGRQLAPLRPLLSTLTRVATFPARRPWFPLDRIGVSPPATLENVAVHATPESRLASDHLPLTAEVVFPGG
jgi:endonuclease/exonuclease/phosphatase family metal-dependent hydrolase